MKKGKRIKKISKIISSIASSSFNLNNSELELYYKNQSKIRELCGKNIFDFEDFKPLIDFYLNSEHRKELKKYCENKNIDFNIRVRSFFDVWERKIKNYNATIPDIITRYDIVENTEIYQIYCNCINKYINGKYS
jgi:hypothetical protein